MAKSNSVPFSHEIRATNNNHVIGDKNKRLHIIMSHPMSSELPGNMIEIASGECLHFDVILVDQSDAG
jgi:hypothetical protein